jgi:hypothetical protein
MDAPSGAKVFVISGNYLCHSDFLNRIQGKIKGKNSAGPSGAVSVRKVVRQGD